MQKVSTCKSGDSDPAPNVAKHGHLDFDHLVGDRRPPMVWRNADKCSDWITSQAIGQQALRDNLMSDVRRLIYSLGLHLPSSQSTATSIEVEIGRRLYWEAYAMDKSAIIFL